MERAFTFPVEVEELREIAQKAKDWALMHGIGMRPQKDTHGDTMVFAPLTLFPSIFPKRAFYQAKAAQQDLNELIHKVAHNHEFLQRCLSKTIEVDPFTASLYQIYDTVRKEGIVQPVSLAIVRSDYLLHSVDRTYEDAYPQQVEINTIASSFGSLTTQMYSLHRYIMEEFGAENVEHHIPENRALRGLTDGIIAAWKLYGVRMAIVLFVVEPVTVNICDQRMMEFDIRTVNKSVIVVRRTLAHLAAHGTVKDGILFVDGLEVAVVYYRTGYAPEDFAAERAWEVRLMIERSKAIKCPSIQYHLAGTKKVQQELAIQGVLENFLSSTDRIKAIRELFTGLYSLDMNDEGNAIIKKAIENPSKYVLKPQREGGGNNFYDEDLRKILLEIQNSDERTAYILMDRICPPPAENYLLSAGSQPELCEMASELGVFGVIIGSESEILHNEEVGHLLRTKKISVNEGGVAAGFAALDSVYLI